MPWCWRDSIVTFSPSTWSASLRPWRNARIRSNWVSGEPALMMPITGAAGCCARAGNGPITAAPPSSDMKSRRLMPDIGLPPALAPPVHRTLNLPQRGRELLGPDLKCSESCQLGRCNTRMEGHMPASTAYTMRRSASAVITGACLAVCAPISASANVIIDWDAKAIAAVEPLTRIPSPATPYGAYRVMGVVHAAMSDGVKSIERRYRAYLVQLPADAGTSKEAAAAAAAAAVLATIDAKTAHDVKIALADYLVSIPDDAAKSDGVKLGEAV